MRVRVLGSVGVDDADDGKLGGPKPRTVLAALALSAGRTVSLSTLIDAVWGEDPPASATKSLQTYVARLRACLGGGIEGAGSGYRLGPGVDVDALEAEVLAARAGERRSAGDPAAAADLFGDAVSRWQGPSLTGVAETPWAAAEATRLDELRAAWVEERADALLACGRHAELVPVLEAMVADEPLRERRWAQLITALYRCGRQADALRAYQRLRTVLADELGIDPSAELRALEAAVLAQDPALDTAALEPSLLDRSEPSPSIMLPSPPGRLIGRDEELSRLGALVARDDIRLVTITGPGGSGKTRLAVELAGTAAGAFAHGAAFVDLSSVRDPGLVAAAIAATVGVEGHTAPAEEVLERWLGERELLLVLDNVEQVVDAAADIGQLLRNAPGLTIVATSRRVLRVRGEHVFPLLPLGVDAAAELFVERATARDPTLVFDAGTEEVARRICTRVDCLPLAVELAAARTATLTPEVLLDGLRDRLTLLGPGPRDAPARQQTLSATLAWSTDLLTEDERRTLARLSVFAGSCSPTAAAAVCDATVEDLTALIDSSLLRREVADGEPRLVMLDTIREHATDLFASAVDRHVIEASHARYYTDLAERTLLKGQGTLIGLSAIDRDLDDFRLVHDRAQAAGDDDGALRVATALYRYWYLRGLHREGWERTSQPFERGGGDPPLRAAALRALAGLAWMMGHRSDACALAERGVDAGTQAGVPESVLACHTVLGIAATERRDFDEARRHLEASAAIAVEHGFEEDVQIANNNLGEVALRSGDLDEAKRRYTESMAWSQQHMDQPDVWAMLGLGVVAYLQDQLHIAVAFITQAHNVALHVGIPQRAAVALVWLATAASRQGDQQEAARMLGRVAAVLDETGGALERYDADVYEQTAAAARGALGAAAFADLVEAGRSAASLPVAYDLVPPPIAGSSDADRPSRERTPS